MKALSLTQPWATLCILGYKCVETRSWSTAYRGTVAIHASAGFPKWAKELLADKSFRDLLSTCEIAIDTLPLGVVLGTVDIVDCRRMTPELIAEVPDLESQLGIYKVGRYAWDLANPVAFPEPIPAKGARLLWEWEGLPTPPQAIGGLFKDHAE